MVNKGDIQFLNRHDQSNDRLMRSRNGNNILTKNPAGSLQFDVKKTSTYEKHSRIMKEKENFNFSTPKNVTSKNDLQFASISKLKQSIISDSFSTPKNIQSTTEKRFLDKTKQIHTSLNDSFSTPKNIQSLNESVFNSKAKLIDKKINNSFNIKNKKELKNILESKIILFFA